MKVEPVTTPSTKVLVEKKTGQCIVIYPDGQQWRFSTYYDWRQYLQSQKTHEIPSKDLRSLMVIWKAA